MFFCSYKDEQSASKSLEKEVILSWKSGKLQSHFCTNPVLKTLRLHYVTFQLRSILTNF